ncbi:GNAT family N-acetyltransferase [Novosphingobium sp. M1R2S20]|uniref:GNAT family N-acetyltransferase n=1 Tax=Novosphingobium rhizovicinum TaxID=3228928 RepID=A0ABV3R773_9SPHN
MIRTFRPGDQHALRNIHLSSITRVGPLAYSPAQVAAWAGRIRDTEEWLEWHRFGDRITVSVASDGQPVAFALLEADGHLDMLYCHPDHLRQGHALRLVEEASAFARSVGLSMLYTEASELARPVFEAGGYKVEHRQDFLLDGVPIHNYAMSKVFTPAATSQLAVAVK